MFFFKIKLVLHRLWITHIKDKYGILDTEDVEIIAKGNSGLTLDKDSNKKRNYRGFSVRPQRQLIFKSGCETEPPRYRALTQNDAHYYFTYPVSAFVSVHVLMQNVAFLESVNYQKIHLL